MHKARENTNGSFSIGKTWNMEELSAIESFSSASPPQTEKEAQYRSWAGSVGFVVTITKPYYWQAGTAKEKDFFVASAVKIYRKYTKGQVPELRGFDESQKAAMLGVMPGQPQPPPPQQLTPPQGSRGQSMNQSPAPPHPPFAQRPQSREDSRYRESPGPPSSMSDRDFRSGSGANSRHPSESRERFPSGAGSVPRPFASTEHLRSNSREGFASSSPRPGTSPGPGGYPRSPPPPASQMPPPPTAPSTNPSQSQLRSESPANLSISSGRERAPPFRPQSPPRKGSYQAYQQTMERVQENGHREMAPPPNGAGGQAFFASARQRMAQQPPPSPSQAPQLPPLETSQPFSVGNHQRQATADQVPQTTESEVSSAGIDAAAMAGLTGFLGPDHSQATTPQPTAEEPSSPSTPERSRQRPSVQDSVSDSTLDLRPAPLNQRSKPPEQERDFDAPSEHPTPRSEKPPEIKPLSPTKNKSESNLQMPGAFQQSPLGPSPLGSPPETPDERKEEPVLDPPSPEQAFRPGLGPMIKKQAVANKFKRAATAANAFKPRPGGAAEKILKLKEERDATGVGGLGPDGITAVVPRPSTRQEQRDEPPLTPKLPPEDLSVKEPPKVEVSSPVSPARSHSYQSPDAMDGARAVELHDEWPRLQTPGQQERQEQLEEGEQERVEQRQVRQPQVKVKRRSAQQQRYLEELGVDPSLLADKCLDFEATLYEFGWNDTSLSPKALSDMEAEIKREQSRLEAGSWLSGSPGTSATPQENSIEDRAKQVQTMLDRAIQECDELDGLLTLYNVELSSLNTDVAFIEAQSQGLQVQAANQRLLHNELKSLMDTMSLDRGVLEPLRRADLADTQGLEDAEQSLVRLYQAMITIDPNIRSNAAGRPKSRGGMGEDNQISAMAAVRSKRDVYERESNGFCQRLMRHLDYTFIDSLDGAKGRVLVPAGGNAGAMRLNADAYSDVRRGLWMYSPLILFTKELNQPAWQTILRMYYSSAKLVYSDAFMQNMAGWKRAARKPPGDESDILFTAQEKDEALSSSGALTSARKLTVKRSQTLAKTLRNASGGYNKDGAAADTRSTVSLMYCQVFSGAMDEMAPLISQEQNFIVDLFHATSLETADFMDAVAATPPAERHGTNLLDQRPMEPNREIARRVTDVMLEIFGFYRTEMSTMMDWSMSNDPIQGVGVMACLSRHAYYLHEGSQEFLIQLVDGLVSHLQNRFAKFVEDQVKAIEDTKVKIKKRKGVISFMRTFPQFATAVENTFAAVAGVDYDNQADCMFDVRQRVDEAYSRINKAMFDSLKVIAKEGPTATSSTAQTQKAGGVDDPEDKEMLNYHVLMIENMNYFIEEVDDGGHQGVLAEWKGRALMERAEALEAYVGQVIRRPLGKLLVSINLLDCRCHDVHADEIQEFLDSIDSIKESHPHNPGQITSRPTYSRKAARNMLSQYDSKEVRRGIDTLRRRIEKHFHDADDEPHSKALINYVCKECERFCEKTVTRIEDMIRELYPVTEGEKNVEIEFSKADVQAGLRR